MSRDAVDHADLKVAAAQVAAEFLMRRPEDALGLLRLWNDECREAITARVTYDLFRMRGKEVAREWLDLLYGEAMPLETSRADGV